MKVKPCVLFALAAAGAFALRADEFLIGELPSFWRLRGWIAFPHTDATVPCIHDFYAKG